MNVKTAITSAAVALVVASASVPAQSLGELARREEARRAASAAATKIYSNADLGPGGTQSTAPSSSESCYMSIRLQRCVTAEELIVSTQEKIQTAENAKKEPIIRQEAESIRTELARLQKEIDTLTATADNAQRSEAQRSTAAAGVATRRSMLAHLHQRWSKLEKMVEQQRYPREWIEPVPDIAPSAQ